MHCRHQWAKRRATKMTEAHVKGPDVNISSGSSASRAYAAAKTHGPSHGRYVLQQGNRMTFCAIGGRSKLGLAICAINVAFVPPLAKRSSQWIMDKGEMTRHRHQHGTKSANKEPSLTVADGPEEHILRSLKARRRWCCSEHANIR